MSREILPRPLSVILRPEIVFFGCDGDDFQFGTPAEQFDDNGVVVAPEDR